MALCDFLIVGAMKSGTTTLYRDLYNHPHIFLPESKEPEILLRYQDAHQIETAYARLFAFAKEHALRGEASTGYTKRSDGSALTEGVAARARAVLGPELRVIYIERDPIARAISHYRHDFVQGTVSAPIDEALRANADYVNFSRYDWQIAPWIEAFGERAVLRLHFEEYVADRAATLQKICDHLDIALVKGDILVAEGVHNSSSEKRSASGRWLRFIESDLYQLKIKPRISKQIRRKVMEALLPKARASSKDIRDDTRTWLQAQLAAPAPQFECSDLKMDRSI